ncbi:MAG: hypothetical protein WCI49_12015 [Ferruginibacter sp.]
MNRLFLSILGIGICFSALATTNTCKFNNRIITTSLISKKQVKTLVCTVTVNLQQEQSYFCETSQSTSTTLISVTSSVTATTCAIASHDAQLIAQNQMVSNTLSWLVIQINNCDANTPPQE